MQGHRKHMNRSQNISQGPPSPVQEEQIGFVDESQLSSSYVVSRSPLAPQPGRYDDTKAQDSVHPNDMMVHPNNTMPRSLRREKTDLMGDAGDSNTPI
eukprot:TRINITY_DN16790_c0_g1_i1.p1 TRINITY_DN16790_c0_g1~~TRINITY_DN16790_c0_g1_i1.p1  ORF type:complete len:98 (-),score=11.96 TRINITY_DN16790_c0_g1_i1:245-538(-)